MSKPELNIDESSHRRVPTTWERAKYAFISLLLGFLLINIVGFWLFPGIGIGGLYLFSNAHSMVAFLGEMTNVLLVAFLAIFAVFGWFNGASFTDRLKHYISWWKFW